MKGRYKSEVAAFRLAEALGIANVPPACVRVLDARAAAAALALNDDAAKLFADEAIVEQGKVYGALIPWIDGLSFWPLEKEPLRTEARTWLGAGKPIPAGKIELARQASTLVAFDFITGNWDRYSGENVGLDSTGAHVLFIDNDAAFLELPPKEQLARNKALLDATNRLLASLRRGRAQARRGAPRRRVRRGSAGTAAALHGSGVDRRSTARGARRDRRCEDRRTRRGRDALLPLTVTAPPLAARVRQYWTITARPSSRRLTAPCSPAQLQHVVHRSSLRRDGS